MNMLGTLTTPISGSSSNIFSGKASIHALLDTKPRVVAERTIKRPNSLYEVLRVDKNATPIEIKTAYRSLAKIYHPDASSHHGDHDFIDIHNAYATLSDPEARAMYDQKWSTGFSRLYTHGYNTRRRWETDQCW